MATIRNPDAIAAIQIRAQIGAVKLEQKGMTRRGRSMSAMLKDVYGLPKSASYDQVLEKLNEEVAKLDKKLGMPPTGSQP